MDFLNKLTTAAHHLHEVPTDAEIYRYIMDAYDFCIQSFGEPADGDQRTAYIHGFPPGLRWSMANKPRVLFKYVYSIDYRYDTVEQQLAAVCSMMFERFALPIMAPHLLLLPVVGIMQSRLKLHMLRAKGYIEYANFLEERDCKHGYIPLVFENHSERKLPAFIPISARYQSAIVDDPSLEVKYQQAGKLGRDLEALVGWSNLAHIINCTSINQWISRQKAPLQPQIIALCATVGAI